MSPTSKPNWDLLICANDQDRGSHEWFPAKARLITDFTALEGMHFRNCYLTSKAIEKGSWVLFQILYRTAKITGGHVLHISDYREYE